MNKKIKYFMAKDTRLIMDNLTKVIVDEDMIVIKYTMFRKNLDDLTITAIRYYKSKNTMIIYDELKEYDDDIEDYTSVIESLLRGYERCEEELSKEQKEIEIPLH